MNQMQSTPWRFPAIRIRRAMTVSNISSAFLLVCSLTLPNVVESQSKSFTAEGITTGQAYSDTIINYLKEDLRWLDSSTYSYDRTGYHTLQYLITKLADDSFAHVFSSQVRKWGPKGGCVELDWKYVSYYTDPLHMLPIHPFLPKNNGDVATLCSFRETTELSFLRLPIRIRDYAELLIKQRLSNDPHGVYVRHQITGDSLKQLFPDFAQTDYWMVSGSACEASKVSALIFVLDAYGPNQIRVEFENPLWKAIFAFPVRDDHDRPRLVPYAAVPAGLPFGSSDEISVIPTHENGPVFVGKKCPVGISLEILWDAENDLILQMWACFDNDWGNHHPCFDSEYLVVYKEKFFVLRVDDELAELISVDRKPFQRWTLADETAPEL